VREAHRVHEEHHVELLRLGEEALELQARVGQVDAVDVGADLHAAHAELLHAAFELTHRQLRLLQRHAAQADETAAGRGGDLGDAVVDAARQLQPEVGFGVVVVLGRRGRDGLHVDAHAVHVLQPRGDVGQLGAAVLHLLHVVGPRRRRGVHDGRLLLEGLEHGRLRTDLVVLVVAMEVDHHAAAGRRATGGSGVRRRRGRGLVARQHGAVLAVFMAGGHAGEEHRGFSVRGRGRPAPAAGGGASRCRAGRRRRSAATGLRRRGVR